MDLTLSRKSWSFIVAVIILSFPFLRGQLSGSPSRLILFGLRKTLVIFLFSSSSPSSGMVFAGLKCGTSSFETTTLVLLSSSKNCEQFPLLLDLKSYHKCCKFFAAPTCSGTG